MKKPHLLLILLLTVSVCITTSYQLFVNQCWWWNCAPERNFSLFDLNLPSEIFPPNSDIRELQRDRDYPSIEEAATTNRWDTGVAIYILRRFASNRQAEKRFFWEIENTRFDRPAVGINTNEIIRYQSNFADYYQLECGYIIDDLRCKYWASHEEYYIYFAASVGETDLEPVKFIEAINYIDNRMGELLGK